MTHLGKPRERISRFSTLSRDWGQTHPGQHSAFSSPALSQGGHSL